MFLHLTSFAVTILVPDVVSECSTLHNTLETTNLKEVAKGIPCDNAVGSKGGVASLTPPTSSLMVADLPFGLNFTDLVDCDLPGLPCF